MWHNPSKKSKSNCNLYRKEVHELEIVKSKGLTIKEGYRETAKSKSAIVNIILLDKYYLMAKSEKIKKVKSGKVRRAAKTLLKTSILKNTKLFTLTTSEFIWLVNEDNYKLFDRQNPNSVRMPELHILLGVKKTELFNLQVLIKSKTKPKIGE